LYETLPAGTAAVTLHPDDAGARGIATGDRVRVHNSLGELILLARVDDEVRRGVASIPKGLWRSATLDGHTSNAVVPEHVDEIGGGACYNDARVEVTALRS
jgi:anaerobic selenocysteine-containing dehydrogenase